MDVKNNSLINTFQINKKDIITIVGAGGKTSLMLSASSYLRKDYKVLVTTTTHIYMPEKKYYDEMIVVSEDEDNNLDEILETNKKGVYIIGSEVINNSNKPKLKGLSFEMLDKITPYFDIIIIEGDGSREKPLKGWKDNEPVVYSKTTKTIGVIDINSLGLDINEENVHRVEKFLQIVNENLGDERSYKKVSINHLKNIITNKKGLFKISIGEKILFINKCENEKSIINAKKLINKLKNETNIDKLIYGSVIEDKFTDLY